jgi:hypothetical protein
MSADQSELPDLIPTEPLTQVVFVHDYLQLVFQFESFSIYNVARVSHGDTVLIQGAPGFCDAVVSLIGQRVREASSTDNHRLSLTFESGENVVVLSGSEHIRGPEAFEFNGHDNLIVVEQNG